ncbi:MAG: nucleotidyltransferase domain-containing protein [Gammaproteobacteria bacterium]
MSVKLPQKKADQAVAYLIETYQPEAILLYGSRAKDTATPKSDIDLAILLGRQQRPDAMALAASRTELEHILGSDVDLIVLDHASPILAMQILRNHQVLYQNDSEAMTRYTMKKTGEYFDLKYSRRFIEQQLLAS